MNHVGGQYNLYITLTTKKTKQKKNVKINNRSY